MKFSTREDIELPVEDVFSVLSDFERMERAALRRGAEVARIDTLAAPGPGMAWTAEFTFRGKRRALRTELAGFQPPETLVVQSAVSGLVGVTTVDLVRLAPRQTRMAVALDLRPQTLSARMFLQTLRLAKTRLSQRFTSGVSRFARELEAGTFHRTDR